MSRLLRVFLILLSPAWPLVVHAATAPIPSGMPNVPLADWVEPDFPFFSTVLDAGYAGPALPGKNLTPRALVLNLGRDCWVAFDTDLLRVAAIWRGRGVTPKALAPGSYHDMGRKTRGGQFPAPEPDGTLWVTNGIYPGWETGLQFSPLDPREPAPSPEEVGRGPMPKSMGRLKAVRLVAGGAVLEYTAGGAEVREWMTVSDFAGTPVIERHLAVGPSPEPLLLAVGARASGIAWSLQQEGKSAPGEITAEGPLSVVRIPAHAEMLRLCLAFAAGAEVPPATIRPIPSAPPMPRWPQEVMAGIKRSSASQPYVVDEVAMPYANPWRRSIRMSDIQFLPDGTGVGVTIDGDVWLIRGLGEPSGPVRWRRFTSGLHEPMTVAIRDGDIYAFDRNGIWRLRDTNGDGEADVHELFSNAFGQTADMREFPSMIRLAPHGEFIIAKGGQEALTHGKHNGSVLRISADGRHATVLGYGFRQPNIGVNLRTGLVTASDQQGQYIPSTPLHVVRDRQFYGYLAEFAPREQYPAPIADPLTWIPHSVNASAMSQVWLFGARMGPLNDQLVHIGFNKPELFRVLLNARGSRLQASVVSITDAFSFPLLHGSVNPADGQLYIAGFQVLGWGNVVNTLGGLARVRYTGAPVTLPTEITPMQHGVLLRFDIPLDPKKATDPTNYALQSWHYLRTYKYGSAQYKADGTPGMDTLAVSSAYLSQDGRAVFLGVPDLKPVMQLQISWSLATSGGVRVEANGYTTPYELVKFDPVAEGFGDIKVDLTPRTLVAQAASGPVSIAEGRRVAQMFGCVACHATSRDEGPKPAPPWVGLFGRQRPVTARGQHVTVTANEAYVRESILEPAAKIAAGYEKGEFAMPSFAGVLNDAQIQSLILYIKTLQ